MNKTERTEEIINQLTALENRKYKKAEYLPEMLRLQSQMADVAFDVTNSEARIWDVYDHLKQLNTERGNIADEELARFKEDCKILDNRIKAEMSGDKGENLTYQSLEKIKSESMILRNVELEIDGVRTEIDFIVFTKKAIFIIEVKNSKRDIFISDEGDYYRYGRFMRLDCNIREKMKQRESFVTRILNDAGFLRTNIVSLLVFTDNRIEVENNCKEIDTTFLSQLPYKIDRYNGWNMFTEDCIDEMVCAINNTALIGEYTFDADTDILKRDFAELMTALEPEDKKTHRLIEKIKAMFGTKDAA